MKEANKVEQSIVGAGLKSAPMDNIHQATKVKAKGDPWSVVRSVRLPHKPGAPLSSGGGSDGGG